MSAWGLPVAAASFWFGLLLWQTLPRWIQGSSSGWAGAIAGLVLGGASLTAAWLAAPGESEGRRGEVATVEPIAEIRSAIAPAVAAIEPGPRAAGRHGAWVAGLLVTGVTLLGVGWGGIAAARLHGSLLARLGVLDVAAQGTLREDPAADAFGWYAQVDLSEVSWAGGADRDREAVWVEGSGAIPKVVRGDRVFLRGVTRTPSDQGFADSLHQRGIAAEIQLDRFDRLGGASNPLVRAAQLFRAFVGRSIDRLFPPKQAGLLLGLALGDASHLDPAVARDFQATGLGHLLVVSGENVAMVLAPMLAVAAALRLGRRGRFATGLGTVGFFVVLTGAEPSVMRAGLMATLTLFGVLAGRPRSAGSILAASVLVLLILDPWLVWSIGFQLSVAATAGMVALAGPVSERISRHAPRPVALAAGTTMAAQLGVTPLLLFHFHQVPGVTVVANVAAFPAVAPALVMGLIAASVGLVSLSLGRFLASVAGAPLAYLEWVANRLAKAPVGHITSRGGPAVLLVGGALVIGVAWWLRSGWRPPGLWPRRLVVMGVAALPLFVWSSALSAGTPTGLTLRFFDVGQGDAVLVSTPQGAHVLVDGGPDEEQVATDLEALGVKRLDVVVATHPHADHIVGLPDVLAQIPVGLMLEPGCPETSAIQTDLDAAAAAEHVPVRDPRAGDRFFLGDLRMDVLSPDRCWVGTNSDPNNDSLVILMTYHGDTALFGAEPEQPAQQLLLDEGAPLRAEVLKVPHHGAATSLPAFFEAVDARIAVISVGPNDYGHPVPSTIRAIRAAGSQVWRTDQHGDIVVTFSRQGPVVDSDR